MTPEPQPTPQAPTTCVVRWPLTGRGLVLCGLVVLILATILPARHIVWVRSCVVSGGMLCGLGIWLICGIRSLRTKPSASIHPAGVPERPADPNDLEQYQRDVAEALQQQFDLLEQRQQALSERLMGFQEWLEYPQPQAASEAQRTPPTARDIHQTQADRKVLEILHAESQRVFAAILDRRYVRDDGVAAERIRDDLLNLASRIASVYQPQHANPLLSANLEQLLRAGSRACLHLLIVVEQLPWNAEQRSLESLYSYISSAVSTYGAYKKVEPFLGFLNKGFYVGRFLAGSNPLTLGTWWLAGQLGKQGGQALARKFAERQAITFIHELLRVVGYEVAGIYGGDFRHRDPHWIYGAELTQLVNRAPISRSSLRCALEEVSQLQLRNEYDRLYLYRCLAQRADPGPHLRNPALLTTAERESTLARLERFYHTWVVDNGNPADADWQTDVEDRFQMQLKLERDTTAEESPAELRVAAAESLWVFCQVVLGQPADAAQKLLLSTGIWQQLSETERSRVLDADTAAAELEFVPPSISPSHAWIDTYLEDLVQLATSEVPSHAELEALLIDVAAFYRRPASQIQEPLDRRLISGFVQRWPECHRATEFPADLVRALHQLQFEDERPLFAMAGARLEFAAAGETDQTTDRLWLCGTSHRLMLIDPQADSQPLWFTTEGVQIEQRTGIFLHDCVVRGGQWSGFPNPELAPAAIVIPGTIGRSYHNSFAALINWRTLPESGIDHSL